MRCWISIITVFAHVLCAHGMLGVPKSEASTDPSQCDVKFWGLSTQWQGRADLPPQFLDRALACCHPLSASYGKRDAQCRDLFATDDIVQTFPVRPGFSIRKCVDMREYNVKVGVELGSGVGAMLRYSPHGSYSDYLAFKINKILEMFNTPLVAFRRVHSEWLLEQLEDRPYSTNPSQEVRTHNRQAFKEELMNNQDDNGTVMVSVQGWVQGSVDYKAEDSLPYPWLDMLRLPFHDNAIPANWRERMLEISDMCVFDYIIGNRDRFHTIQWQAKQEESVKDLITDHRLFTEGKSITTENERRDLRKKVSDHYNHLGMASWLDSFNIRALFGGGPLMPIDQSDALLVKDTFQCNTLHSTATTTTTPPTNTSSDGDDSGDGDGDGDGDGGKEEGNEVVGGGEEDVVEGVGGGVSDGEKGDGVVGGGDNVVGGSDDVVMECETTSVFLLHHVCVFRSETITTLLKLTQLSKEEWMEKLRSEEWVVSSPKGSPTVVDTFMSDVVDHFGDDFINAIQDRMRSVLGHVNSCLADFAPERVLLKKGEKGGGEGVNN